jgi:hypothetical protein
MSYASIAAMARSSSLALRITAAASQEGVTSFPDAWVADHIWQIVSADASWSEAWDYAVDATTLDDNPDTGARPGVINDAMILAVVQPMITAPPTP